MIQRIKTHNILNGIKFSIAEFFIIALVISPFAIYYLVHARMIYALVSVGILLNCLAVAIIGWRQWLGNEKGVRLGRFMDKAEIQKIGRENPHLLMDTLMITITALVPYLLIALVAYELLSGRERIL